MYAITIYFNSLNFIIIINLNQLKFYIKSFNIKKSIFYEILIFI